MKIYVGNLSREITKNILKQAFGQFGRIETAEIIKDKYSGLSKGYGFVEMPDSTESHAAMQNLNGKDLMGKTIVVKEARPRAERRGGHSGGYESGR